ncbi:DUF6222 family protein [Amycolatopsis thailandensis]|uniref:DUF6222 family protein n=1 Tax=Amycolatopsis thailandensis TaxID=589330 RepID=UPI00379D7812
MTANPASTPIPTTVVMPRMGRGVCWSDVVHDIELDEHDRQTRAAVSAPPELEDEPAPERVRVTHREAAAIEAHNTGSLPLSAIPIEQEPPRRRFPRIRRRSA